MVRLNTLDVGVTSIPCLINALHMIFLLFPENRKFKPAVSQESDAHVQPFSNARDMARCL